MRAYAVLAAALATAAATAAPAPGATTYTPGPLVTASTPASPFVDPCPHQAESPQEQVNFKDTEVEPLVAVNPTNQDNVIGVYQEDRWSDGGAHGLPARSFNGGAAYGAPSWAEFSACSSTTRRTETEEKLPRATDPWVTFDKGWPRLPDRPVGDGRQPHGRERASRSSVSDDGGMNWSAPSQIQRTNDPIGVVFLDKESITADPYHANRAWATWIQGNLPGQNISFNKLVHAFSYRGTPMVSRTTDGGDTWTAPAKMTNANLYAQGNQIVVEPDGTLVDIQAILFKGSGNQRNRTASAWP